MDAVRTLIALGREDEARSRLELESRAEPAEPMPVAILVSLDAADRHMDRALQRIAAFEQAGGSPADAAEIRGDLQAAAGRHAEAADAYARAGRIRPNEMLAMKEYYARVAARSATPEAVLQRWLERNPRSIGTRYLLGEHYHKTGQHAAAVAEYERLLQRGPHAFALNNLALLYQDAGDRRATATAKRAYEMAPGNPAIADTYGWILVQRGDTAEGLRVLEAATRAAPSQPDIRYHFAAAQAVSGRKNEAIANLRVLLESAPQFDSRRDAESLLASLSGG
jgi:cytochrome c-type biogenesis protein CcmH/NrfG